MSDTTQKPGHIHYDPDGSPDYRYGEVCEQCKPAPAPSECNCYADPCGPGYVSPPCPKHDAPVPAPAPSERCANDMDCGLPASEHRPGICCPPCRLAADHKGMCAPAPAPSERCAKDMLAEFGAAILDAYTDYWRLYLDDGDLYDMAVAHGLIVQRTEKHPPEAECEACAEFDAPCCEVPPNISRAVTALLKEKP